MRINDIKEEKEEMEDQIQELKKQALKSNTQIEELTNQITNGKDDKSRLDNSTAQVTTQLVESKSQQSEINQKTDELSNLQIEVDNRTNALYLVFTITVILGVAILILLLKTRGRKKLTS
jgi:chromosome segregation ATPase